MEKYLKQIADELRLIRKQLERENDLYEKDMNDMQQVENKLNDNKNANIADALNRMFNK